MKKKSKEIWKSVVSYEGKYEVSNLGDVKSCRTNKLLCKYKQKNGYMKTTLGRKSVYVHRLVAIAFLKNPHNKDQVNHKDCNKQNNHVNNLEWSTYRENQDHAIKNKVFLFGQKHPSSKLKDHEAVKIRELYFSGQLRVFELAKKFKVSRALITLIIKNKRYNSEFITCKGVKNKND